MDANTIQLDAQRALSLVNNLLPILETIPQVKPVSGEIGLAASGAQVAIPILIDIGKDLAEKGLVSAAEQQSQLDRFAKVLDFTGAEWKPSNQ